MTKGPTLTRTEKYVLRIVQSCGPQSMQEVTHENNTDTQTSKEDLKFALLFLTSEGYFGVCDILVRPTQLYYLTAKGYEACRHLNGV